MLAGPVRVVAAGVPSLSAVAYSYNALSQPPRVFAVAPLVGPAAGGTPVLVLGESFTDSAAVAFVERDASGALTGNRFDCVWRGKPGMACNDTAIRCLSPPLTSAGRMFDVFVTASGASSVFSTSNPSLPSRWTYEPPVVGTISPVRLPPQPAPGANLTITGRSFGALRGAATAGPRTLQCPVWTDGTIVCEQPAGVSAEANVTVVAASGVASGQAGSVPKLMFLPPVVAAVEPAAMVVSTEGGNDLQVYGENFGHPLPVSVWLVRRWRDVDALRWSSSGPVASPDAVECPVMSERVTTTSLVCAVPPGIGTGWSLVVVNYDDVAVQRLNATEAGAVSLLRWRASLTALNFSLAYAPPVLVSVLLVASAGRGGAPAVGGFSLRLVGTNFGAPAPLVTVGSLPCVVQPGTHSHDSLTCAAPSRQVDGDSLVRVVVDGQPSGAVPFAYDPPVVTAVAPTEMLALAPAGRPRLTLYGMNFGERYRADVSTVHAVRVGPLHCGTVFWAGDGELSCEPEGEVAVGPADVVMTLAGNSSAPFPVMFGCPVGWFARPGDRCARCPTGALCAGGVTDPVSLPGHFPLSPAVFVQCAPRTACLGGISGADLALRSSADTTGCSRLYRGDRCAECAVGAYRLKGKCAGCPNTAWLLFLGFSLAVIAAVAAAVYLAGKRINMAGLSIGVVRVNWSDRVACAARSLPAPPLPCACVHTGRCLQGQSVVHQLRAEALRLLPPPLSPCRTLFKRWPCLRASTSTGLLQ